MTWNWKNWILSLKKHLAGHNRKSTAGSLEFQCEHSECSKTFGNSVLLGRHQNIHRNNVQKCYFCPWSGALGKDDLALTHYDRHLLHPRYQCSGCGKKFYLKRDRDYHFEGQHEKIAKKYSCKLCLYQTHSIILLTSHVKRKHWFKL